MVWVRSDRGDRVKVLRALRRSSVRLPLTAVHSAYDQLAEIYPPHAHNALMRVEEAAMLRHMPPLKGKRVLDLACGTGRYGRLAQEDGAAQVVGVDLSLSMLRSGVLSAAQARMDCLPFLAQTFEVVLCGLAIGHLPPSAMHTAYREIARILVPGGIALISDFHPYLALRGGQRRFTLSDGRQIAIAHFVYFLSDHFAAMRESSMILEQMDEPLTELGGEHIPAVMILRCIREEKER